MRRESSVISSSSLATVTLYHVRWNNAWWCNLPINPPPRPPPPQPIDGIIEIDRPHQPDPNPVKQAQPPPINRPPPQETDYALVLLARHHRRGGRQRRINWGLPVIPAKIFRQ